MKLEKPMIVLYKGDSKAVAEDMIELEAITVNIDDDNAPAPENIPRDVERDVGVLRDWGHDGICLRRLVGGEKNKARLKNFLPVDLMPTISTI